MMAVGRAQWESGEIDGTWRKKVGQRDGQGERESEREMEDEKKQLQRGKSFARREKVKAPGKE
jgi:hypothetical protein